MNEVEKLRVLLPHWIEHNEEHAAEYERWSAYAGEAAEQIKAAVSAMIEVNEALSKACKILGGPVHIDHLHSH